MESDRNWPAAAACLGAGALVAAALPPWGWWPLAWIGLALLGPLTSGRSRRSRFVRGWLFALGWLAPGMGWMWFLTAPGYIVASALFATYHGIALAVVPVNSRIRWLTVPAAITLAEALRFCAPFGGVPLASLPISQVAGPLSPIARVGGPILFTFVVAMIGSLLSEGVAALRTRRRSPFTSSRQRPERAPVLRAAGAAAIVVGALAAGLFAPAGDAVDTLDVAFVQGGGPQGTRAIHTDSRLVVERHLAALRTLEPGPDLVVWPENVIDVPTFAASPEYGEIAAEAKRLGAPILVGITEDVPGRNRFLNAQVAVEPDGSIASRYDKVRRVPFGEYVPMRGLLESLGAPVGAVPRDAVAGTTPAVLETSIGRVAVVISWEVFFAGRAREGVEHGGQLLINPTNGSSYTGTVLQSQQVASSRLRAIENGRWEVQVSPTGFSAFVSPDGDVDLRTGVSERAVRHQTVELRTGRTWANTTGDKPWVAAVLIVLLAAVLVDRRVRRR